MSLRLVMPMSRMLFSASTPSILLRNWFTTESFTPVPPEVEPRERRMASISSRMMMCRSESSPFSACSASASLNSARTASSEAPTYLLSSSGPFTIFGGAACSAVASLRAMSVLPQPGGPYSSMPRTCVWPIFLSCAGGTMREAKARRKISRNCASRPPMPSSPKLKPLSMIFTARPEEEPEILRFSLSLCAALEMSTVVILTSWPTAEGARAPAPPPPPPDTAPAPSAPRPMSTNSSSLTVSLTTHSSASPWWYLRNICCPRRYTCPANTLPA